MDFANFITLANILAEEEDVRKEVSLALLKELCRKEFEYVHTIPQESRNKAYILSAFKTIQKKIRKADEKSKHKLNYSLIAIFEVVLKVLRDAKVAVVDTNDSAVVIKAFQSHLLEQLKALLHDLREGKVEESQDTSLTILSIIDALTTLGDFDHAALEPMRKDAAKLTSTHTGELNVGARLATFMFRFLPINTSGDQLDEEIFSEGLCSDVKTIYGRQSLCQKADLLALGDNQQKLRLLKSIFGAEKRGLQFPDKLLAARRVIIALEGMSFCYPHTTHH